MAYELTVIQIVLLAILAIFVLIGLTLIAPAFSRKLDEYMRKQGWKSAVSLPTEADMVGEPIAEAPLAQIIRSPTVTFADNYEAIVKELRFTRGDTPSYSMIISDPYDPLQETNIQGIDPWANLKIDPDNLVKLLFPGQYAQGQATIFCNINSSTGEESKSFHKGLFEDSHLLHEMKQWKWRYEELMRTVQTDANKQWIDTAHLMDVIHSIYRKDLPSSVTLALKKEQSKITPLDMGGKSL